MNNDPFKSIIENAEIGYHSPIEVILQRMQTKIEDDCMEAVQRYGFNINKEELEKALRYDRDQYRQGFNKARELYRRPQGHWIYVASGTKYKCNLCKHYVQIGTDRNYCPNCGAEMLEGGQP